MAKKKNEEVKNPVSLKEIVDAGEGGLFSIPYAEVCEMLEEGLVEVGELDGNGCVPVRATDAGYLAVYPVPEAEDMSLKVNTGVVHTPTASGICIEKNVPVPSIKRQGRADKYPFDFMDVNDSFFIPATETDPEPAKRMSSTVSSATARFSVPSPDGETRTNKKGETVSVMVETRKFVVRARTAERDKEQGARVWRVK